MRIIRASLQVHGIRKKGISVRRKFIGKKQLRQGKERCLNARKPPFGGASFCKEPLAPTYFPTYECAVSWAMKRLTAEFGMGSGVPSFPWPPRNLYEYIEREEGNL